MDTDTLNTEISAVGNLLAMDVEAYFKDDIDSILKRKHENLNVLVREAEGKFRKLMDCVYVGKNKWRSDAWNIIWSHLLDERQFIFESMDTTTVCTYALYIEAAFLYLRRDADRKRLGLLDLLVYEDVRRVHAYVLSEHANDMPEQDKKIIAFAMTMAAFYVQRLRQEYPDTI